MELPKRPYLRPPTDPHDAARRAELIARAIAQRDEILTYFATVDHWNRVRQPDELPIDPDPDGSMRDWLRYYNALYRAGGHVGPPRSSHTGRRRIGPLDNHMMVWDEVNRP